MRTRSWMVICMTTIILYSGSVALAQPRQQNQQNRNDQNRQDHTKFDDHDKQVAGDWYKQHQDTAPVGLRSKDRLSPDEESRLKVDAPLDPSLRTKVHPIPRDLSRQLPPPPRNSRYVAVGGHVAQIDNRNRVQDVIHLELNF
jgi:Ni/Co efflux regulator RcnB